MYNICLTIEDEQIPVFVSDLKEDCNSVLSQLNTVRSALVRVSDTGISLKDGTKLSYINLNAYSQFSNVPAPNLCYVSPSDYEVSKRHFAVSKLADNKVKFFRNYYPKVLKMEEFVNV